MAICFNSSCVMFNRCLIISSLFNGVWNDILAMGSMGLIGCEAVLASLDMLLIFIGICFSISYYGLTIVPYIRVYVGSGLVWFCNDSGLAFIHPVQPIQPDPISKVFRGVPIF